MKITAENPIITAAADAAKRANAQAAGALAQDMLETVKRHLGGPLANHPKALAVVSAAFIILVHGIGRTIDPTLPGVIRRALGD